MNKYIRQEKLDVIGIDGQVKIKNSKIAIIGIGALGTVSAELLVRAGIGEVLLVDKDKISIENIHRQFLFKEKDVGKLKTLVSKRELKKINSDARVKTLNEYLSKDNVRKLKKYDLVLDCTDNMAARFIINDYCIKTKKIWIHAAASGTKGNVLVVDNPEVFKKIIRSGETFDSCAEIGVINTLTTMISSIQVTETIKIIIGKKHFEGLIRINPWKQEYDVYKIKQ